ncbi:MAG: Zn-dependent hydrolase [Microcoleaceae cyanobacterium]
MSEIYYVDVERIEKDLYELSKFGYNEKDKGIYRPGLTEIDMEARQWLMDKFRSYGFKTYMDGVGNVIGRIGPEEGATVAICSHLDSVPCGGMFDGSLGVIAGLECLRVIQERDIRIRRPIEVIATSEEEGRFGGMLGAQALAGDLRPDWLESARSMEGEFLKDALAKFNMNTQTALHTRRPPNSMHAFVELHVEQGPVLETEHKTIGVVEGISGIFKWIVRLIGKADHAGTSPMNMRSDAFMGLASFASEIPRIVEEEGTEKSRLTVGYVELKPGNPHTIPGEVEFSLVGRDLNEDVLRSLADTCRKALSAIARRHRLMFEYDQLSWLKPQPCHSDIVNTFEDVTRRLNYKYMLMPSGAGHDVQFLSAITKAGMIFVPSVNGVSHAPDEWTHWEDIEKGANVLLNTVVDLAN